MKISFKFTFFLLPLLCLPVFAQDSELPVWQAEKDDPHAVSVHTVTYKKELKVYDYEVKYPYFASKSPAAEPLLAEVNYTIRSMVNKEMEQIRAAMPLTDDGTHGRYGCSCNYRVVWATTSFISVAFDFYSFMGGAHGITCGKGFNYCLNPLRKLTLANLFGSEDPYKRISDLCRLHLYRSLKNGDPDEFVDKGTMPEAKNFENFTFDDKGIQITFQPYQVAPYSEGMPFVVLSYRELAPLISDTSPIRRLAGVRKDESLSNEALKKALLLERQAFKKRMERI